MLEKVSFKANYLISLLLGIGLILSSCMSPVDIQVFLDDETVKSVIDKNQEKGLVIIDPDSDDHANLTAGNREITGLASNKYYRLEEYDGTTFKRNLFVRTNGNNGNLELIGKLAGNKITNLQNDFTYKVKYATPFTSGIHKYFAWNDASSEEDATIASGEVTVSSPIGVTASYFLDIATLIDVDKNYLVMKIPLPGGTNATWGDSYTSARLKNIYNTSSINEPLFTSTVYDVPGIESKKLIGIFQFTNSYTGGTPLIKNTSLLKLEGTGTQSDYVFAEYDTNGKVVDFIVLNVTRDTTTTVANQTPVVGDFTITIGSQQTFGSVTEPTITPKPNKSTGTITIYYTGTGSTSYLKNTTLPTNAGSYSVTFDVAAVTGWNAEIDLLAGALVINKATPEVGDFDISNNLVQSVGSVTPVTATAKFDKTGGTVTVSYEGTNGTTYAKSITLPTNAGSYAVTFDVGASSDGNWNAVTNLLAGTLFISTPTSAMTIVPSIGWSGQVVPALIGSTNNVLQSSDINITVNITNASAFTSFVWYIDGTEVVNGTQYTGQGTATLTITGDVSTLTTWYQVGVHTIGLRATDANGQYFGTWDVSISQ